MVTNTLNYKVSDIGLGSIHGPVATGIATSNLGLGDYLIGK